jgi:metal-responsive CopG/Arc/MetJ family transcriptional regulator
LTASSTARSAPRLEPKRLIHVRLPLGILEEVDARIGADAEHRSQVIRKLIRAGLEAASPAVARGA